MIKQQKIIISTLKYSKNIIIGIAYEIAFVNPLLCISNITSKAKNLKLKKKKVLTALINVP